MDSKRFATVAKTAGSQPTRRGVLRVLAGGTLGGTLGLRELAATAQDVVADRIGCRDRCWPG